MKGKDLTERIYRQIKRDLMMCRLPSSELFSEQMLADRYNCSRTPAREAAGRLVSEGFLNKYPSKGYIVRLPTEREITTILRAVHKADGQVVRQADDGQSAGAQRAHLHAGLVRAVRRRDAHFAVFHGDGVVAAFAGDVERLRALDVRRAEAEQLFAVALHRHPFPAGRVPQKQAGDKRQREEQRRKQPPQSGGCAPHRETTVTARPS